MQQGQQVGSGRVRARSLGAAALLLFVFGAGPAAAQTLAAGKTVEGRIEPGDPIVTSEIIARMYSDATVIGQSFELDFSRGGPYFIDLRSPYFDSYLVLRDGSGKILAEDDDGLVSTHSRIVTELDANVRYTVEACALHGQKGEFELSFERGEPKPGEGIEWTEREIEARTQTVFREDVWKKVKVVESKHYLIFTDGSAGKKFGKILDKEIYEGFKERFPFEKPDNVRRLPIYLFNTRDGYVDFLQRNLGMSPEQARATGGIAYMDFYATSYTSPRAHVHFHECAHQIMSNLLGLVGGGSWYQEGVAEYYEDKIAKFNREAETRMLIRTGQSVPLRELLGAASMLFSAGENTKGGGGASGNYGQAASIILFLKEGPHASEFERFLRDMGRVPRGDVKRIEAVFQDIYGLSIEELEAEWKDFFAG